MVLIYTFFSFLFLTSYGQAAVWPSDLDFVYSEATTLKRGTSQFGLGVQQRVITHKLTADGDRIELGKAKLGIKNLNKKSIQFRPEETGYNLELEQTRYIPSYLHGLTRDWSIGALITVTRIKATKNQAELEMYENDVNYDTQIGHAALVSKYNLVSNRRHFLSVIQKMGFPTAERESSSYETGLISEADGYAIGAGGIYKYRWKKNSSFILQAQYEAQLPDQIKYYDEAGNLEKLNRDPGDQTEFAIQNQTEVTKNLQLTLGVNETLKARDKIESVETRAEESQLLDLEQTRTEVGLTYALKARTYLENSYLAGFKYHSPLKGKNVEDASTVGVNFQILY